MKESDNPIAPLSLGSFRFPGRAGGLQDSHLIPDLVDELGANYESYHGQLAAEYSSVHRDVVAGLALHPSPADPIRGALARGVSVNSEEFFSRQAKYLAAAERRMGLIHAEVMLRVARAASTAGTTPSLAIFDATKPLLSSDESALLAEIH